MSDMDRIRDALQFIGANDRDTWLRMGMAVKSELGDTGFDLWNEWSEQDESYDAKAARDVWKSIREGGKISIATLFHEAKAGGWHDDGAYQKPTPEDIEERRHAAEERAAQEEAKIARERTDTAKKAALILKAATEAKSDSPYLVQKQVAPVATLREIGADQASEILGYVPKSGGEPLTGRLLVVPVKQGKSISTLELIDGYGRKSALAGRGSKAGGYWASERLPDGQGEGLTLLIGEGVATVLSARESTGHPAIAALSSVNLCKVASIIRGKFPKADIVILADLVKATGEPDPHAAEAARAVGGRLALPDFGPDREPGMKDFNDLAARSGLEAVSACIAAARAPDTGSSWPDPQPLSVKVEPQTYPLEALPDTIRAAVEEVTGFVKAPVPMVAGSALAALSLAIQTLVDVKRAEKLTGPVGLFLLTIADSGERKSTCDGFFTKSIRDYEAQQAEEAKPILKEYETAKAIWEAKYSGIKEKIKQLAKENKSTLGMEQSLHELEHGKPEEPRTPRLLYADATPEALAYGLAKHWPAGGVVSAEAGVVFGSHGMGKDSVMRNLGLLNQLWDGSPLTIDRRTSECFTVRGARLTMALQVQEPTLREFFDRSGALARGTGFLARFLVAWPESTQGMRPFTEAPENWPALAAFNRRIASILAQPVPIDDDGALNPAMMSLTPEAKTAWIEFHDDVEIELRNGGDLHDVRDVASKAADNAVRLASLFQVFGGAADAIGIDAFNSAASIVTWHLSEARRFFGEMAMPLELMEASRLDTWLIEYCKRERTHLVGKSAALQYGPLRKKDSLDAAIRELVELDRLQVRKDGRRLMLAINPALIGIANAKAANPAKNGGADHEH